MEADQAAEGATEKSPSGTTTSPASPSALGVSFVVDWDRYEMVHFVGRGGMGSVYKARDRRLDRTVAIKFVLGSSPPLTQRFLAEARAQARIDHPNVCRVFEVGEVSGRPYIALQFIDGEPLYRIATKLSLPEKIAVMRDVASAVQEAHDKGVVHRDLKPGNVLVEPRPEGRWHPVVVDFGLAREVTRPEAGTAVVAGATESGVLVGTPAYMSPEQARGDLRSVDRRSDVYGLGATLYEVLTGSVPYSDPSPLPLLSRVVHEGLPSPRALVPDLPVELEAITLKCLARDPGQRYASASALADDLGRYLDGEPILGRKSSFWRRARRAGRRHRALAIGAAAGAVVLAGLVGIALWAGLAARRTQELARARAQIAERLGREATEIEAILREAHLRPLHDVRPERRRVLARMRAIEERAGIGASGAVASGDATDANARSGGDPVDPYVLLALGRGHLALGQWTQAAERLGAARAAGLDTPELHAALGRALGELYRQGMDEATRFSDDRDAAAWLAARRADLATRYLTPALEELRSVRGSPSQEEAALLGARIGLYARDFPAVERAAREVAGYDPQSSEAQEVLAEAAYMTATEAADHGDDARAAPALARAAEGYDRALQIARSDAALYRTAAQTWLAVAESEHRQRRDVAPALRRALELVEKGALAADPDDACAHAIVANVLLRKYWLSPGLPSTNDVVLLEQAIDAAERAVAIAPDNAQVLSTLGAADIYRGSYEFFRGGSGAHWWNRAIEKLERALQTHAGVPRILNALGLAHRWTGEELDRSGGDPSEEYRIARLNYERAIASDGKYVHANTNRVELFALIVEHDESRGSNPGIAAETARTIGQECLLSFPISYVPLNALARVELATARWLLSKNENPLPALTRTRDLLRQATKTFPNSTGPLIWRSEATRIEATYEMRRGANPTAMIERGRMDTLQALRALPDSAMLHIEAALFDLLDAQDNRDKANSALEDARRHATRAVAVDARSPEAWIVQARIWQAIAASTRSRIALEKGIWAADEALRLNPMHVEAKDARKDLELLRRQRLGR